MIREFVPELRNMEDPELIDWPSRETVDAPLLIGLESKTPAIEQAISTSAQSADLHAEPYHFGKSPRMGRTFGEGYGVRKARITYAYAWTEDATGVSATSEKACHGSLSHHVPSRLVGCGQVPDAPRRLVP